MFSFTDAERAFLTGMRGLTTDAQGQEVLVGLTLDETKFYMEYTRKFEFITPKGVRETEDRGRYLKLHNKYDVARLEVIGTEVYLRKENPPQS
jgi:hypothetical protein